MKPDVTLNLEFRTLRAVAWIIGLFKFLIENHPEILIEYANSLFKKEEGDKKE